MVTSIGMFDKGRRTNEGRRATDNWSKFIKTIRC